MTKSPRARPRAGDLLGRGRREGGQGRVGWARGPGAGPSRQAQVQRQEGPGIGSVPGAVGLLPRVLGGTWSRTGHVPLVHVRTSPRLIQPRCQPGPHAPQASCYCSCCAPCPRQDTGSSQITLLTLCVRGQLSSPPHYRLRDWGTRNGPLGAFNSPGSAKRAWVLLENTLDHHTLWE